MTLTRRHRLWESYLTEQLDMDADKVHHYAEQIEHLLTDEETKQLEQALAQQGRRQDPHGREIPENHGKIAHNEGAK